MHFPNLAIIKNDDDVMSQVVEAMGPDQENGGFWDWFQFGGRWRGILDGYHPTEGWHNPEICYRCNGTGKRGEIAIDTSPANPTDVCNRCEGTGKNDPWAALLAPYDGDIKRIEHLTEEQLEKFYRVVLPNGEVFSQQEKPSLEWLKKSFPKHFCVVVDTHE